MWVELYGGTAEHVAGALGSGPLVLAGLPGSGRAPLIRELAWDGPVVEIRPRQAATPAGLKLDVLNEILEVAAAWAEATTREQFQRLAATIFGSRVGDVIAAVERGEPVGLSMAEVIAALPDRAHVIVHDAHRLPALSDSALWALRARAQDPSPPRIALLTREWHRPALIGPDAPFFGFGQAVDLPVPSVDDWARIRGGPAEELAFLSDQTRRLPRPTFAVLDRMTGGVDLATAWRAHVNESGRAADQARRLAYGLHPYGPRLLAAIAGRERVYRSVPEARTDAIAAALRLMRDHDLIYQPRPRQWVIADPALEPHLASGPG